MRFAAIVTAAGKGTRMGRSLPKQYMEFNGKPLIWYSLNALEESAVDDIYITCPPGDEEYVQKNIVEKYGFSKVRKVVAGGNERSISVLNGVKAAENADFVMIHDAARPLLSKELIKACMESVVTSKACVPALPVSDTIKAVSEGEIVAKTLERDTLRAVQTPQCFERELLLKAYEKLEEIHTDPKKITDDASVVELSGLAKVTLVQGEIKNRKVTNAEDLVFIDHYAKEECTATKKNARPVREKVMFGVIAVTLLFIWLHSFMPQDVSSAESGFVYDVLFPFLRLFLPDEWVTELLIRKAAHFSEYALLGAELLVYAAMRGRLLAKNLVNTLFTGLFVAFMDETIQIFSGRGPMITDVWIDVCGFTCGACITLLIARPVIKKHGKNAIKSKA